MYRDAVQLVVNEVWKLDKVHSTKKLHTMFYEKLRVLGFRAHHVLEVCKCARDCQGDEEQWLKACSQEVNC